MDFKLLLQAAWMNKVGLARALGLNAKTVYEWRNKPPKYATAYLMLMAEYNKVRPLP